MSAIVRLLSHAGWLFAVAGLATCAVYGMLVGAPGAPDDLPSLGAWVGALFVGDLGFSSRYRTGAPVFELVLSAASESAAVVVLALVCALLGAAVLAWLWSSDRRPTTGAVARPLVYVLSASPAFLLAYWTVLFINGSTAAGMDAGWWTRPAWFPVPLSVGALRYLLAAVVLAVGSGVLMEAARGLSAELDRMLGADFILFARASGRPLWRHVAPNLVGPVATLAVNRLIAIFGGSVVVEVIFNVPGLGRLTWDAALLRDAPVLLGTTAVWAVLYATARLLAEISSVLADPRLRRGSER
ncbi:MAG: ABC transporter permease [Myxococcota bacterium]